MAIRQCAAPKIFEMKINNSLLRDVCDGISLLLTPYSHYSRRHRHFMKSDANSRKKNEQHPWCCYIRRKHARLVVDNMTLSTALCFNSINFRHEIWCSPDKSLFLYFPLLSPWIDYDKSKRKEKEKKMAVPPPPCFLWHDLLCSLIHRCVFGYIERQCCFPRQK